jgi:hypothetical protein
MPQQPVIEDIDFLKKITQGHASAYKIHAAMKKQAEVNEKQPMISYSNIAERMLRLARDGLIEVTQVDTRSIHGRKDYRLTSKGIHALIFPDANTLQIKDAITLIDYLEKVYHDKQLTVGIIFLARFVTSHALLEAYCRYVGRPDLIPMKRTAIENLTNEFRELTGLKVKPTEIELAGNVIDMLPKQKASGSKHKKKR